MCGFLGVGFLGGCTPKNHADWQWITTEYQTGVEEGTGSRSSWRVVATDLSCLRVMMMMMVPKKTHRVFWVRTRVSEPWF